MKVLIIPILALFLGASQNPWKAPLEADKLVNPLKESPEAIKSGKKLFSTMCTVCHGVSGKGDGVAGAALNPKPTNMTTDAFHAQSDGAIYWKITEGRTPMASYKATLSDEQRWQLVSYLRSLK